MNTAYARDWQMERSYFPRRLAYLFIEGSTRLLKIARHRKSQELQIGIPSKDSHT